MLLKTICEWIQRHSTASIVPQIAQNILTVSNSSEWRMEGWSEGPSKSEIINMHVARYRYNVQDLHRSPTTPPPPKKNLGMKLSLKLTRNLHRILQQENFYFWRIFGLSYTEFFSAPAVCDKLRKMFFSFG
jgi:hypothetical protein